MTKLPHLLSTLTLCFLCTGCWITQNQSNFSLRNGRTFEVAINGVPTYPIPERYMIDSEGYRERSVNWEAESDGSLCLSITPQDPDLKKVKSISLTLVEVREDRPAARWRRFTVLPYIDSFDMNLLATPIKGYCAEEFVLTPRLRLNKLTPGTYILGIHVNSFKNWDAQSIKLTVR